MACSVCRHPERAAIDAALLHGEPSRDIAGRFGFSKSMICKHRNRCVDNFVLRAKDLGDGARSDRILARIEKLAEDARGIRRRAVRRHDHTGALAALREELRIVEMLLRLRGDLQPASQTVNVAVAVSSESGGHLIAKLSSLISGARERQLPAGDAEGEVITVERAQ